MAKVRLTNRKIASLKPRAERYEIWESGGFGVRVFPSGERSFVYIYRMNGKSRRMTLGPYPRLSLARAHVLHAQAREKKIQGIDPGKEKAERLQMERRADTVSDLIETYLVKHARPKKRSAAEDERMLRREVESLWGNRKAKDITRRDIIQLLDDIVERGSPVMANRCLAVIRRMFRFAIQKDILGASPCVEIEKPAKETPRDRVLRPSEIKTFWNGLASAKMTAQVRLALRFMLVTAQRRGEVAGAPWSEFDLEEKVWEIPGERTKNGRAHRVPLSGLAVTLLEEIRDAGAESEWLFPSRKPGQPIDPPAISHAVRNNLETIGIEQFTPHDLRRTAASHMTELGTPRLTVEKLLNHSDKSVTAIYDRYDYAQEKRRALERWAERLSQIVTGAKPAGNVVPIHDAAG